jgi:hypothetical protein
MIELDDLDKVELLELLKELEKRRMKDGKEADYKCSEVCRDGERGQKQLPKSE